MAGQFPSLVLKDSPQPLFAWPQGLAWDETRQMLYIADGHSIRAVRCVAHVSRCARAFRLLMHDVPSDDCLWRGYDACGQQ